ncbi:MAG: prolyl oligopeptidase family serine peptidase [Planctomycetia bacterium]|nr:prolyl oligopeptidase family serine peptidase [Planctomycetia bacterium]
MNHRAVKFIVVVLCVFGGGASPTRAADPVSKYAEHQDLSYYLDANGQKQPIKTPADWAKRRADIAAWMQTVMGPLPKPEKPVPLDMQVEEEIKVGDLLRQRISYHTDSTERRVKAFLFRPVASPNSAASRQAAILCLHQTTNIGKSEPAGLGGNPNLHYALHLAQRGYVTLAPDYPSFGEYQFDFAPQHGYTSGSMKAIYDNIRAVDLLQSLPFVDGNRIGCIGHSLGGHNTMFTAFFEPRIKCLVSNCGFTRFHKYYNGALKGWTSARYMPLIDSRHHNNPDEVPFDFPEIVAAFAPRPFLASSPIGDSNFEVSGVKDSIGSARPIYDLFGAPDALQANYPECAHDFPEAVREVAYKFFDKHLGAK